MARRWILVAVVAIAILILVATALGSAARPVPSTAATPTASPAATSGAGRATSSPWPSIAPAASGGEPSLPPSGTLEPLSVLLAMLPVAPEDRTGYQRSLFVHWIDADGNGCDTRHEVLIAQAIIPPHVGARCALTGGRWLSLYDGLVFTDPSKLQIDHVVPLAEAWDSGASRWSPDRREAFANDLGVPFALLAVSAATNESKSDDDPTDWLPPAPAAECPHLGDWIAVKVRWDLSVDPREHDALLRDIGDCPATRMPFVPFGET